MNQTVCPEPAAPQAALPREIDDLPLPYVEIDARGTITRANRAALALHHPGQGSLVGMSGWDLIALDEKVFSHAAFSAQIHSGLEPPLITRNIFNRTGSFRTYQMHRSMMRDHEGNVAGMRMILVDVTETTLALESAVHAQQWLENAMASLPEAVILTDILGVVCAVNPAAEALIGFSAEELAGKVIEEVAPMVRYEPLDGVALDRRAAIERRCNGIATLRRQSGSEVSADISVSPILDKATGSVIGVAAILRRLDASS